MVKPTVTGILVADSAHADLYLHRGPGKGLDVVSEFRLQRVDDVYADDTSDRRGRTFDRSGAGRHALEPKSDLEQKEMELFLKQVVQKLGENAKNLGITQTVLAAPPKALATLRRQFAGTIKAEIPKNLTQLSTADLEQSLDAVLPVTSDV